MDSSSPQSWRHIVRRALRIRTTQEKCHGSLPSTPTKSAFGHPRPSDSFSASSRPSRHSPQDSEDDNSSFMSPVLEEFSSRSPEGSNTPDSSDNTPKDWDEGDETSSIVQSFIDNRGIMDYFPEPPVTIPSQTLLLQRRSPRRLPNSISFSKPPFIERRLKPTCHPDNIHKQPVLVQARDRNPTHVHYPIRHGPVQYSTTSIPFDLLSRTRQARSDRARSGYKSRNTSAYSWFFANLRSFSASHTPPRLTLARSRSCNIPYCSNTLQHSAISRPTSPMSQRLSTSNSLQNLRSSTPGHTQPLLFSSSNPPSLPRPSAAHVPGLEHRVIKISRGKGSERLNSAGSHAPLGTARF